MKQFECKIRNGNKLKFRAHTLGDLQNYRTTHLHYSSINKNEQGIFTYLKPNFTKYM